MIKNLGPEDGNLMASCDPMLQLDLQFLLRSA